MAERTFVHDQYTQRRAQFAKLRDCFEGQDAIKEGGTTYLPRPGGMPAGAEGDAMYAAFKQRAIFYPVLERTLRALLGIVFRVPPQVALPGKLEPLKDSLTPEGDSLAESLRAATLETLHMGRHGLLLDLPRQEAGADARPYAAHYAAEDILDWREEVRDGARVVTMVTLRECPQPGDANDEQRLRELLLEDGRYIQRLWVVKADKGRMTPAREPETIEPKIRGESLGYIPFWFIGPYGNKPRIDKSPMLDLVNAALSHYEIGADWRHALHMLAQPTPFIIGDLTDDQIPKRIGAGTFWILPATVLRVDMLEYSGAGVGSLEDALNKLESFMAGLGAKLVHRGHQPETAEAVRVKARDEISVVESSVMSVEDAYRGLLRTAAEWLGQDPAQVQFAMDRDFIEETVDAAMLAALVKACFADKAISRKTYHANLQRGGIIATSRSLEDEVADGASGQAVPQAGQETPDPSQPDAANAGDAAAAQADAAAVADTALNGAQVTALQGVVQAVADGHLPRDAAKILIRKAFPTFNDEEVGKMIDDAEAFTPAPVAGGTP